MRIHYLIMILSVFFTGVQGNLWAGDTMLRCGGNLISVGDTMYEVQNSCGDPASKMVVGEKRIYDAGAGARERVESITYVTEWVYKGNNGIYLLTFEGSRLDKKEFIRH